MTLVWSTATVKESDTLVGANPSNSPCREKPKSHVKMIQLVATSHQQAAYLM